MFFASCLLEPIAYWALAIVSYCLLTGAAGDPPGTTFRLTVGSPRPKPTVQATLSRRMPFRDRSSSSSTSSNFQDEKEGEVEVEVVVNQLIRSS